MHVVISTNHLWSAPASLDERRFVCLNVGNAQQQNSPYFKAIIRQLGEGGDARLLWDMLNKDISKFDPLIIPQTDELAEQKLLSLGLQGRWWYHRLQEGTLTTDADAWHTEIPARLVYDNYIEFCADVGERHYTGAIEALSRQLEPFVGKKIESRQKKFKGPSDHKSRLYTFWRVPPLHECRNYFESRIGKINWSVWHEEPPTTVTSKTQSTDDDMLEF